MISLPREPTIIAEKDNSATIEIEALYPGYGVTVGNALRRVLYSSLPGTAITQVQIEEAPHEFTTMEHIQEDVLSVCLNLKQVNFIMHTEEPQKGELQAKGEGTVTAGDLEFPSQQVEVVNPDVHIATITDSKGELNAEVTVSRGLGYVPAQAPSENAEDDERAVGTIPLDAIYTPIKRVWYDVQNMRVGERTDFDRLRIDIQTDGSITPQAAFEQAVDILINHFSVLQGVFRGGEKAEEQEEEASSQEAPENARSVKVADLGLSTRVEKALSENSVRTVGGILQKGKQNLLDMEGLGKKSVEEIEKALKEQGIELS